MTSPVTRHTVAVSILALWPGGGTPAAADTSGGGTPAAAGVSGGGGESAGDANPLLALATLTYQPKDLAKGTLRIAGSASLQQAAALWCEGLELVHPDMAWALDTATSESGWEKLLAGRADVALFDRPLTEAEQAAWTAAQQSASAPRRLATIAVGFREDRPADGATTVGDDAPRAAADDEQVPGDVRPPSHHPLFAVVALPAAGGWPPVLEEFVSYVLSFSGQLDVAKDGLLPLSRGEIHAQKEALGWTIER